MSDVFHKTPLGYEEIVSRKHGLPPRLRRCLIMVDGKRSMRDLMSILQGEDITPLIQTLEIEGYIELIGTAPDSAMRTRSGAQLSMSTVMEPSQMGGFEDSQPLFTDSSGQLRKPLPFAERKIRASKVVNELLGPNAEGIAMKIESCKDNESLEQSLRMASMFISESVNPVAARRFKDHVRLTDAPA